MSYVLRDYQKECVDLVNGLPDGSRTVVALATGLGKTLVGASLDFHGRVLWLSHRDELVRQPEKYFRARGMSFGIEKADEHAGDEDVVSASVQSLYRDERLHSFAPDAFDTVVVDEAHHAAAQTYRKILAYFHPRKTIGLTATPGRGDGVRLTDEFDSICFSRNIAWGIQHGYLADIRCLRVSGGFDLASVDMAGGDFVVASLGEAMERSENAGVVADAYMQSCEPDKLRTLVYCPTRAICRDVADAIKKRLPEEEKGTVQVLTGEDEQDARDRVLADFRAGTVRCVVNCMILTEGTDLPETRVILNDRPTANSSLYTQIVGRGTRLSEGKTDCLVIDIVGKGWKDKVLCTAPTLFGIDPDRLPARMRGRLFDGQTDLSAAADEALDSMLPNIAELLQKRLTVRAEMVNIFTQEAVGTVQMAKKDGYAAAAAYLQEQTDEAVPDGFGDLYVRKTPYADKAYRIDATYRDRVYLSEPDMLGHVKVTLAFENGGWGLAVPTAAVSPLMPKEDAAQFVTDFLTCLPDEYAPLWSRSARELWGRQHATEGQSRYLGKLYGRSGQSLTRIEASDLIDLALDAEQLKKDGKEVEKERVSAGKKRRGKILAAWEEKQRAAEEERKENRKKAEDAWTGWKEKDRIPARAKQIRARREEKRKQREALRKREAALLQNVQTVTVRTADESKWNTAGPETEKQEGFLASLIGELAARKVWLDDGESVTFLPQGLLSGQASILIDLFIRMKDDDIPGIPAQTCAVRIDAAKLMRDVGQLTGRGTASLTLTYTYIPKRDMDIAIFNRKELARKQALEEQKIREEKWQKALEAKKKKQEEEKKKKAEAEARRKEAEEAAKAVTGTDGLVGAGIPQAAAEWFIENGCETLLDVSYMFRKYAGNIRQLAMETRFSRAEWEETAAAIKRNGLRKVPGYPLSKKDEKRLFADGEKAPA